MSNAFRMLLLLSIAIVASGCASTGTTRSTGAVLDDSVISSKLKTALLADKTTDGTDIEIEIDEGRVQLNGFADSAEEMARAEEIARNTNGVKSVTNNLRVAEESRSVGRYVDDKLLVARVNGALAKDEVAKVAAIEVEVNRGIVTLGGYVDSAEQIKAAGDAAERVKGVAEVVNNLELR